MPDRRYRVLLTDADRIPISKVHEDELAAQGAQLLQVPYGISEERLIDICKHVDAVLLGSPHMTSRIIEGMEHCRIIARCGIGYDNIDVESAVRKGITVTYVPDYCIEEVSDHTIALMFDCWRKISYSNARVKSGHWDSYERLGAMRRVQHQTLGFIGFGRIARAIARKLGAFGLRLSAYDPHVGQPEMQAYGVRAVGFAELLRTADVISLHVPLDENTFHMIDREAIEQMKRGVILINTSRGKLIDDASLAAALKSGQVGAVGLDVLEVEPPPPGHWLFDVPQAVVTPHSAAFSDVALHEVRQRAIEELIRNFQGLPPLMAVPEGAAIFRRRE